YRWYATLMRRTRALMDGAMADAERLRAELEGLWHADDGDDVWARTVQDVPLRWQQGRLSQVRRAVADGGRRYAPIPAYRCLLARYLGALAALEGDRDDAVTHLEHALAIAAAAGSRPWVAQTECDLARVLAPAARARELAEASLATARELGLDGLAERATALLRTRPAAAR